MLEPVLAPGLPHTSPFDSARRVDAAGEEHWDAREVMALLGYANWQNMQPALRRAKAACRNVGEGVEQQFREYKESRPGRTGPKPTNMRLSRLATYLLAMNGDSSKPEVAAVQLHFVTRAIRDELRDAAR